MTDDDNTIRKSADHMHLDVGIVNIEKEDLEALVASTRIKRDELQLEMKLYQRFTEKMDISLENTEDNKETSKAQASKSRRKGRSVERKVKLTTEQKTAIYKSEIDDLRLDIEKLVKTSNKIAATYTAVLEEANKRIHELKRFWFEFERDIVKNGYDKRLQAVISEIFVKYMHNHMRQRDTLYDKLQLNNIALKTKIAKIKFQLQQKEELGEVLHEVDFEQLKIENAQYLSRIDDKNQELLQLKIQNAKFAFNLNKDKAKLREIESENSNLKGDINQWNDLISLIDAETVKIHQEINEAKERNQNLKDRQDDYKSPSIKDYVNLVTEVILDKKKGDKLNRRLQLVKNENKQIKSKWEKLKRDNLITAKDSNNQELIN